MNILLVDDDQLILKSLRRALEREGYRVLTAASGQEAVDTARDELLDLIISDVRMPGVDGLETLGMVRELQEGLRSIVITGYASEDAPIRAIKQGVDDYLLKPVPIEALLKSVRHSLALRQLERSNRETIEGLKRRYLQIITTLVGAFQDQDRYFFEHSRRVAGLAVDLGTELGLSPGQLDRLELAALLHDVGLAYIDRDLLLKAEALTNEELARLREHPLLARGLLEQVPGLNEVAPLLTSLREWYDGSGSPAGLRGEAIPIEARVLAVAEAYDSLTHDRPHRAALAPEAALEVLRGAARTQYDPVVVSLCVDLALESRSLVDPRQLLGRSPKRQATREKFRNLERLGNLFRESGKYELALSAYSAAQGLLGEGDGELRASLLVQGARLALVQQDAPRAAQLASQARRELEQLSGAGRDPAFLELAGVYLGLERPGQAADVLRQVTDLGGEPRDRMLLRTHLAAGQSEAFAQLFPLWLEAFQPASTSPAEAREAAELLRAAAGMGFATQEALAVLGQTWTAVAPAEVAQPPAAAPGPEADGGPAGASVSLEVRCFGRLRVAVEGQLVDPKEWTTRKAQELFALLVLYRRPLPATRMAELLWPDGSDKVKKNLHTTVSRVRRALRSGRDLQVIANDRDFYYLDPHLAAWADLWEFERVADALTRSRDPLMSAEEERDALRAAALYEGDFLEGCWEDWTIEPRNSLREKWFRLVDRLAACYAARGDHARSEGCFEQMLDRDSCREEAHLGLMRCNLAQGRRDAAVRRYHDYVKVLERELGLSPSPAALELYHQVLARAPE